MQESNDIILIITTKNYPKVIWDDYCVLSWDFGKLDFSGKSNYRGQSIIIKKLRFGHFSVFVVPCLVREACDADRRRYLESIINAICPSINDSVDSLYLFAHDGDFGKSGNTIVTVSDIPAGTESVASLSKLIKRKHAYMFRHMDNCGRIMKHITDYKDDHSGPVFGEEDCLELVDMIDKECRMRVFFQDINTGFLNVYPYVKNGKSDE